MKIPFITNGFRKISIYIFVFCQSLNFILATNYKSNTNINNSKSTIDNLNLTGQKNEAILLDQTFDNETFPPVGWTTKITNTENTWISKNHPVELFSLIDPTSKFSAICPYAKTSQDEWLISPLFEIPENYKYFTLSFYAGFSSYLQSQTDSMSKATLKVLLTIDNGKTWDTIWNVTPFLGKKKPFNWYEIELKLDTIKLGGRSVKLAWQYIGKNGDLVGLDNIKLRGGPLKYDTDIISFSIDSIQTKVNNKIIPAIIDYKNHLITLEVGHGNDFTRLKPIIKLSDSIHATISPSTEVPQVFQKGQPFQYTVTAEDQNVSQVWSVIINEAPINKGTDILSFELSNQVVKPTPNKVKKTIEIEVYKGTPLTKLVPKITLSDSASIFPAIKDSITLVVGKSFIYTVTAQDTLIKSQWEIKVKESAIDFKTDIESFSIPGMLKNTMMISEPDHLIKCEVLNGTNLKNIKPSITISKGAKCVPEQSIPQNFDTLVNYTIISENPSVAQQVWTVMVKIIYESNILNFVVDNQTDETKIDTINKKIFLTMPYETNFDNIAPTIDISKDASIDPSSKTSHSFKPGIPEIYSVTAHDGNKTDWTITISRTPKNIRLWNFDTNEDYPPSGWELRPTDSLKTWIKTNLVKLPFDSVNKKNLNSLFCPWSQSYKFSAIISPYVSLKNYKSVFLSFYAGFNKQWLDSANLNLYILNKGKQNLIWNALDYSKSDSSSSLKSRWGWHKIEIDLKQYLNQDSVQFVWEYIGKNGDLIGIDDLFIYENEPENIDVINKIKRKEIFFNHIPVEIYPNPTNGIFYINLNSNYNIKIINIQGHTIIQDSNLQGNCKFDITNFSEGIYFINITGKEFKKSIKIILNK